MLGRLRWYTPYPKQIQQSITSSSEEKEMRTRMEIGATIDKAPPSPTISTVVDVKVDSSVTSRFTPAPPPPHVAATPKAGQNVAATAAAAAAVAAPMPAATLPPRRHEAPKKRKTVKYCKAPGAPKRFKSAFIFFTMARHKEIRKKIEEKEGKGDRVSFM